MLRSANAATAAIAVLLAVALLSSAGCSSSSRAAGPATTLSTTKTTLSTTRTTLSAKDTFDRGSRNYFPDQSLADRTKFAQEVCRSIKANGDNVVSWLTTVTKNKNLLSFSLDASGLGSFMALSITYKCNDPRYFAQLRQGLAGVPAGVNLGTEVPASSVTTAKP